MNQSIFNIWFGIFCLIILPLGFYLNYCFIKKSGFKGGKLFLNCIIPASLFRIDKDKDYEKEFFILKVLLVLIIVWFIFPFILPYVFKVPLKGGN